jgi:ABC-2 type transport system permease protein
MNRRSELPSHLRLMLALARIELLRLLVDRTSIGLILIVPAVQLVLFGYAVSLTPRNIPIVIAQSCDQQADLLRRAVAATGSFRLIPQDPRIQDANLYISTGRTLVVIDCPPGQLPRLVADASDPSAVRPAVVTLGSTILENLLRSAAPLAPSAPTIRWHYNPDARSAWSLAPGLVGVIVMITMLMLGALTLVREREQGSWEGLLSTPITGLDALIGKLAPYLLVAVAQAVVVIALARLMFDVPVLGNVAALVVASAVFALAHLTLGFSLSALSRNAVQAIQGAVFFYLPSMLLSGFMFPFEGMPKWAQSLGNALPLTHFVRSARGVMLKGYDAHEVMAEMWPVVVFALGAGSVAVMVYRRQLN